MYHNVATIRLASRIIYGKLLRNISNINKDWSLNGATWSIENADNNPLLRIDLDAYWALVCVVQIKWIVDIAITIK